MMSKDKSVRAEGSLRDKENKAGWSCPYRYIVRPDDGFFYKLKGGSLAGLPLLHNPHVVTSLRSTDNNDAPTKTGNAGERSRKKREISIHFSVASSNPCNTRERLAPHHRQLRGLFPLCTAIKPDNPVAQG